MREEFKILGKYLVSSDASGDEKTLLHGDAKWSDAGGVTLSGDGYVQVPANHFQAGEFSFAVFIKPEAAQEKSMYIYSDWSRRWSFRMYLRPRKDAYQIVVELRREMNGVEPMIANAFGKVLPDVWTCLAVSWDGHECLVFKNSELISDPKKREAANDEVRIQGNDHAYHEVGVKLDSKNGANAGYFVGEIKNLTVAQGSLAPTKELEALGCSRESVQQTFLRTPPYVPGMNGVMAVYLKQPDFVGDENTKLEGDAVWAPEGVILGDKGNVKVPAVDLQSKDFTIGIFVNPNGFRDQIMTLFSDWRQWWSFWFFLLPIPDTNTYQMRIILRRNVQQESDLVFLTGGVVEVNVWSFLSVSWNREQGVCKLFVNGKVVATGQKSEQAGDEKDIQVSDREFYDVGLKGDSENARFVGRLKSLFILNIA